MVLLFIAIRSEYITFDACQQFKQFCSAVYDRKAGADKVNDSSRPDVNFSVVYVEVQSYAGMTKCGDLR